MLATSIFLLFQQCFQKLSVLCLSKLWDCVVKCVKIKNVNEYLQVISKSGKDFTLHPKNKDKISILTKWKAYTNKKCGQNN